MNDEIIRSVWEATSFHLEIANGDFTSYSFSEDFKSVLRALHLQEVASRYLNILDNILKF